MLIIAIHDILVSGLHRCFMLRIKYKNRFAFILSHAKTDQTFQLIIVIQLLGRLRSFIEYHSITSEMATRKALNDRSSLSAQVDAVYLRVISYRPPIIVSYER